MPKRVAVSTLNATTRDILNVIRQNAGLEYQNAVPVVEKEADIPRVGEIIFGSTSLSNQFLNALVNRIALVKARSATFNNPYEILKKGYLEYGESIEDIFVSLVNVQVYDEESAKAREFQRNFPDVKSVFYAINWRVVYPETINESDLNLAFLSNDGVTNLIAKMVDAIYTSSNYDEYLLFKYLIIKAVSHGKMYPVSIGDGTKTADAGVQFRGHSNMLPFMSSEYNEAGVKNTTPKDRQVIFMDAMFNAKYDIEVLAGAFNMDKAEFMGRLFLVDNFATFDNDRFTAIREKSDGLEEVTQAELDLMKHVKAILIDEEWFQVYDKLNKFTEKYMASTMEWNYFYHVWKIVTHNPFANAIVFVDDTAEVALPDTITAKIVGKTTADNATVLTVEASVDDAKLSPNVAKFVQTKELVTNGIGVHEYGAYIIPANNNSSQIQIVVENGGATYTNSTTKINANSDVGMIVDLTKAVEL